MGISDFLYGMWSRFLTWFGKLKLMPSPHNLIPILVQDKPFRVDGEDILSIMEVIRPGDVLLRGYDTYVDGKFIPDERGYSHAGIYAGNNEVIHAVSPTVSKTSIIDFCISDRVMVLRPIAGQEQALKIAESLIGVPYDFNYESGVERLYCFELIANCYEESNMPIFVVKKFLGLVKKNCYLAKSIYENPFFCKVIEVD